MDEKELFLAAEIYAKRIVEESEKMGEYVGQTGVEEDFIAGARWMLKRLDNEKKIVTS